MKVWHYRIFFSKDADTKEFYDLTTKNKDVANDRVKDLQNQGYIAWIKKVKK